jgi:hypothetical protein
VNPVVVVSQIEGVLASRLQVALKAWCKQFSRLHEPKRGRRDSGGGEDESTKGKKSKPVAGVTLPPTTHYVILRNSVMSLEPPLPQVWLGFAVFAACSVKWDGVFSGSQARTNWIQELHRVIDVVSALPQLQASRYDQSLAGDVIAASTGVATSSPGLAAPQTTAAVLDLVDPALLQAAYQCIEDVLSVVGAYVDKWLAYQARG